MKSVQVNKCLRNILVVKWSDIISNVDVKEDQTTTGVSNHQNTQMELDSIGHTLRKANSNIKKQAIEWNPQGHRT